MFVVEPAGLACREHRFLGRHADGPWHSMQRQRMHSVLQQTTCAGIPEFKQNSK